MGVLSDSNLSPTSMENNNLPTELSAVEFTDVLLWALLRGPYGTLFLEPTPQGHRVSFEAYNNNVVFWVDASLGDAVAARLSFLVGVPISTKGSRLGHLKVRFEGREEGVMVGIRSAPGGLSAEVWKLVSTTREDTSHFDLYEIQEELGKGGFGVVYRGLHKSLRRPVAIKILHKHLAKEQIHQSRFFREAQLAARVRHPGLVEILDFGMTPNGEFFLVMELVEGEPLRDQLQGGSHLEEGQAIEIALNIARALGALHRAGLMHRDLKPDNIFVGAGNATKIGDFGAVKEIRDEPGPEPGPTVTQPGIVFGTPLYMSPEHIQGKGSDHRLDIYALGCILFEMISGRPPFNGRTHQDIFLAHCANPVPRLPGELPPIFTEIIERSLDKNPETRYQSAEAMAADLERAKELLSRQGWRRWVPI